MGCRRVWGMRHGVEPRLHSDSNAKRAVAWEAAQEPGPHACRRGRARGGGADTCAKVAAAGAICGPKTARGKGPHAERCQALNGAPMRLALPRRKAKRPPHATSETSGSRPPWRTGRSPPKSWRARSATGPGARPQGQARGHPAEISANGRLRSCLRGGKKGPRAHGPGIPRGSGRRSSEATRQT